MNDYMAKELKEELIKMLKYTDKWIDEALGFNERINVKRCLENARNGITRSKELLDA